MPLVTMPLVEVHSILIGVSICLPVQPHISKTTCPKCITFCINVTSGCGWVILWWQCNGSSFIFR